MYQIVENIARFTTFIPLFLYFLRKSKLKEIKVIFLFLIFILIHQLTFSSLRSRSLLDAANIFNLFYTPIELLFSGIFIVTSSKSDYIKSIIKYILIFYFILWGLLSILFNTQGFQYLINGISYSIMIFFCIIYLFENMKSPDTLFIYSQPSFWGVVGFLLFASGTFFVFLYYQLYSGYEKFLDQYVYIHAIFFIVRNVMFTIAISINQSKIHFAKSSSPI